MKKNRIFEEVVEVMLKKYELVSREECKDINGNSYAEQCRFKHSVFVEGYNFPLVISVTHSYRSGMVSHFVGEYYSSYPVSDFNDKDYACLIRDVTGLTEEECMFMVPIVKDPMENFSERLEDYMDELIESCKHV